MLELVVSASASKAEHDRSSSKESLNNYTGLDAGEIRELARTFTDSSHAKSACTKSSADLVKYLSHMSDVPGVVPFTAAPEALDPESPNFDAKLWVKNMSKLYHSEPDYYKPSKLGVAYRNLRAYGVATDADYQATVTNAVWKYVTDLYRDTFSKDCEGRYFDILKSMDGIFRPGELTVVLGRPGSGCSTLLKSIAVNTYGFHIGKESKITYDGFLPEEIAKHHRGDVVYSAETDTHLPHLSVGDTLEFAARMLTPQNRGPVLREEYAKHMASVYMATYGLLHTRNTKVGNDFVRGVSSGERKRVSIAEVSLCGANVQCWDNATRGLDAATALEFIRALKTSAVISDATPLIAIYQCSQEAYDLFDNVIVLYEGYQIYFGPALAAKEFFLRMGYECRQRQTSADYLTSLTNPAERVPLPGYEKKVPRTPLEFSEYWRASPEYAALVKKVDKYIAKAEAGDFREDYKESHVARQANHTTANSPYTVSFWMQVRYIVGRNYLRLKGDPSITIFSIVGQGVMGLILASLFFNLRPDTGSFYYRGAAMFFSLLFNLFCSLLEIMSLFEARPIVEKHKKYALYRPSADALASIISELPTKLAMSISFNFTFYFMVNFRRDAGHFFFYWLCSGLCTLTMSHIYRSLGAVLTSLAGAMTPASVVLLAMIIYAGFVIPEPSVLGWSKWILYINPVSYVFESLMINEFGNREFLCTSYVPTGPGYPTTPTDNNVCAAAGSIPGEAFVQGSNYLAQTFQYYLSHKWRNVGIICAYIVFFLFFYIALTEFNKGAMQKGELVLYLHGDLKKVKRTTQAKMAALNDQENNLPNEKIDFEDSAYSSSDGKASCPLKEKAIFEEEREIFHWRNLTYSVKIKSEDRVILNHVDGYVKPGQVTALMGASGAGKTTLLNCLSEQVTAGVITDGVRMVNGHSLDLSFQRSIGYCQLQDIHLQNSTVREALAFSAYLRQPASVSRKEKDEYVDHVIDLLDMNAYADALVGVAGEGLNVEQRKRLNIGVELVAKPKVLLFLDEPTSGLDSQTAWSICKLMRKLADHGQAILCTIHQPAAILMEEFDRLLFLQKGGQTVYFGELGENGKALIDYFEKYGAHNCPQQANPAEWMLQVVGAAPGLRARQCYFEVWKNSSEYQDLQKELDYMETDLVKRPKIESPDLHKKYAAPFVRQYRIVLARSLQQLWRSPGYIYSKIFLVVSTSIFSGFSFFKAGTSLQGLQNQMFAVFMFFTPFQTIIQQMLPYYVKQREVYEAREGPSRMFSWGAFFLAQITSEIPFQIAVGTLAFFCWYYPIGLYQNAVPTDTVNERGALIWLFIVGFYVYTTTFGHLCISFLELAVNASNLANLIFVVSLNFCGIFAGPDVLPRFWIFMYRASPFTYLLQGILATGLWGNEVRCQPREFVQFDPPLGQTCGQYMEPYIKEAGGYVADPNNTLQCEYCQIALTDAFLESVNSIYSQRWRNYGIFLVFIAFNIIAAVFFYWLARVPKGNRAKKH